MNSPLPAILIGGPPHSGKSVLIYSLTHALRQNQVAHYVLRACPDGEGDFANEADQQYVRQIRVKGCYTPELIAQLTQAIENRHLPLLVDVGGKPLPWQEKIFAACTHAILLIGERDDRPDQYEQDLADWQALMARNGVPVMARLTSRLGGPDSLESGSPIVAGTLAGLERGQLAGGPAFAALVAAVSRIFAYTEEALATRHLDLAPVENALNLPELARTLGSAEGRWYPEQLPKLLDYLPAQTALALYGRAPNWVYTALALLAYPAEIWLFDPRLGWEQPPALPVVAEWNSDVGATAQPGWHVQVTKGEQAAVLTMGRQAQFLDIERPAQLPLIQVGGKEGLILDGSVPYWLLMAAARQFGPHHSWLAVHYPPLGRAVVVYSQLPHWLPGTTVAVPGRG